jgi:hypothetical protein
MLALFSPRSIAELGPHRRATFDLSPWHGTAQFVAAGWDSDDARKPTSVPSGQRTIRVLQPFHANGGFGVSGVVERFRGHPDLTDGVIDTAQSDERLPIDSTVTRFVAMGVVTPTDSPTENCWVETRDGSPDGWSPCHATGQFVAARVDRFLTSGGAYCRAVRAATLLTVLSHGYGTASGGGGILPPTETCMVLRQA